MKRCFFLSCEGYKQGHIIRRFFEYGNEYVEVLDLYEKGHILNA